MDHILIDGKNLLYRAIYVGMHDRSFIESGAHHYTIVLRFINHFLNYFPPKSVHVFWDAPSDEVWRCKLYPEYKGQRAELREDDTAQEVQDRLRQQYKLSCDFFEVFGFRQYQADAMEADDLIYAFTQAVGDEPEILVISSDTDLKQLSYSYPNVKIHNPLDKSQLIQPRPQANPVVLKALTGDKADNIDGYYMIGKKRSADLVDNPKELRKFLKSEKARAVVDGAIVPVGDELIKRNLQLIDLSLCPGLDQNVSYIKQKLSEPVQYRSKKAKSLLQEKRIVGGMVELRRIGATLSQLI